MVKSRQAKRQVHIRRDWDIEEKSEMFKIKKQRKKKTKVWKDYFAIVIKI